MTVPWGWCLLAFDGRDHRARDTLDDAVTAVAAHHWVHPRLVLSEPTTDESAATATPLFDLDGEAHTAYGGTGTAALVAGGSPGVGAAVRR